MCFKDIGTVLPNFNFMFLLEDIGLISKFSKILLTGSSGFLGARLFHLSNLLDLQKNEILKNTILYECSKDFLDLLGTKVSPKIKIFGCGAQGRVHKS